MKCICTLHRVKIESLEETGDGTDRLIFPPIVSSPPSFPCPSPFPLPKFARSAVPLVASFVDLTRLTLYPRIQGIFLSPDAVTNSTAARLPATTTADCSDGKMDGLRSWLVLLMAGVAGVITYLWLSAKTKQSSVSRPRSQAVQENPVEDSPPKTREVRSLKHVSAAC